MEHINEQFCNSQTQTQTKNRKSFEFVLHFIQYAVCVLVTDFLFFVLFIFVSGEWMRACSVPILNCINTNFRNICFIFLHIWMFFFCSSFLYHIMDHGPWSMEHGRYMVSIVCMCAILFRSHFRVFWRNFKHYQQIHTYFPALCLCQCQTLCHQHYVRECNQI